MTPWEASLAGVKAQVIDPSVYHIDTLKQQLQIEVFKYSEMSKHLKSKFKSLLIKPMTMNEKTMLVGVSVPAWTASEYQWAFTKVTSKLNSALLACIDKQQSDINIKGIHETYQKKDTDRFYLIGSLGYTSLEGILTNHYYSHENISKSLMTYLDVINKEYQDTPIKDSYLFRLCISLISIDLTYLWRQSFFILKQVKYY